MLVSSLGFMTAGPFASPSKHFKPLRMSGLLVMGFLAGAPAYAAVARHHPNTAPAATIHVGHHALVSHKQASAPVRSAGTRRSDETEMGQLPATIVSAFKKAQHAANADPFVLLAIAWQESRFNSKARNKHSSARGLLQFTTATWLTVIRDFGARHGLKRYAAAIETDQDGRLSVSNPRLRRAILALRDHPDLQAIMAAERLGHERVGLEAHLKRPVGPADLYVLHLLGPSGAKSFLTQLAEKPDGSSVAAVGDSARINEGLFVRDGRTLTVAEAYADIQSTLNEQAMRHAASFHPT